LIRRIRLQADGSGAGHRLYKENVLDHEELFQILDEWRGRWCSTYDNSSAVTRPAADSKAAARALDGAQGARIWLAAEATDMRCGFDRLAERVRAVIGQDPLTGQLFVFRSRRGDRLKILVWDRDGFVLWYKRLETGVFKLPRVTAGARSVELRASELAMVLDGMTIRQVRSNPDPAGGPAQSSTTFSFAAAEPTSSLPRSRPTWKSERLSDCEYRPGKFACEETFGCQLHFVLQVLFA
jgi:transposase